MAASDSAAQRRKRAKPAEGECITSFFDRKGGGGSRAMAEEGAKLAGTVKKRKPESERRSTRRQKREDLEVRYCRRFEASLGPQSHYFRLQYATLGNFRPLWPLLKAIATTLG